MTKTYLIALTDSVHAWKIAWRVDRGGVDHRARCLELTSAWYMFSIVGAFVAASSLLSSSPSLSLMREEGEEGVRAVIEAATGVERERATPLTCARLDKTGHSGDDHRGPGICRLSHPHQRRAHFPPSPFSLGVYTSSSSSSSPLVLARARPLQAK